MNSSILRTLVSVVTSAALIAVLLQQCRKPSRGLGRLFLWLMNRSHAKVTAWGLAHTAIARDAAILDVGCGGGRTIARLASAAPDGSVIV